MITLYLYLLDTPQARNRVNVFAYRKGIRVRTFETAEGDLVAVTAEPLKLQKMDDITEKEVVIHRGL